MKNITLQEFQSNFDFYISKVTSGDAFSITSQTGTVMLLPHEDSQNTNGELEFLCNHNDAC